MIGSDTVTITDKLQYKKNAILRTIRRSGSMGRLNIARAVGMSNSRVCDLIQVMLDERILIENHTGTDRRGRRGIPVRVNPGYGTILGFDMEALRLRLVACDFAGTVIWQKQQKLTKVVNRSRLLEKLLGFIDDGIKSFGRNRKILGLGLAAAGVTDRQRGVILHYDMLKEARDLPLRDLAASRTGLPCCMDDNINALAVAEWISGAARGLKDFLCFAVRSGIGAGIVINGRLHTGYHGLAGEVGYSVIPNSAPSSQWKYLQQLVSERALEIDLESRKKTLARSKAKAAGELLGAQLASLAAFLDPQAIILAGELIQPAGPLYDSMNKTLRRHLLPELADTLQLLPTQLGPFAAAIGAAHLCFQYLHPVDPESERMTHELL